MRILITGFAGFIGSNLTRMLIKEAGVKKNDIYGIDAYTYAARPAWAFISGMIENKKKLNLRNYEQVLFAIEAIRPDRVYHLAAESHVCRSIDGPRAFIETNILGTFNLLEALRQTNFKGRLVHISTDETFGQLKLKGKDKFDEERILKPTSPYAASKASSDLIVQSFCHTYGLDAVITRCTNNYGPNQHQEKLIPKTITNILNNKPMTVYGSGDNIRDWIHVDDHCEALKTVMEVGKSGEVYCIGSGLQLRNIEVIEIISKVMGISPRIEYSNSRPTDDLRYAVKTDKIKALGWTPNWHPNYFKKKIAETVEWYKTHGDNK